VRSLHLKCGTRNAECGMHGWSLGHFGFHPPFPLTPALSLWERECPKAAPELSNPYYPIPPLTAFLPLLGERAGVRGKGIHCNRTAAPLRGVPS
jgi:hypothetical protein